MAGEQTGPTRESALSVSRRDPAEALEAEGWVQRFTIEAERADEYVELYQSLGEEVRVEPVTSDLLEAEECATCLLAACDKYVVIYTRPCDLIAREHEPGIQVLLSPARALR